jgi:hypothetical protein
VSDTLLQNIQKKRSALQQQRKPVSHLQNAQRETESIQKFVKTALHPDHRWFIPKEEQASIVKAFNEIRKLFAEYYNDCRTPEHFQREAQRFRKLGDRIHHLSRCIHLSLDFGFYGVEPKGLTPGQAVEVSLKRLDRINSTLDEGVWGTLPVHHNVSDDSRSAFEQSFHELKLQAETLLKQPGFQEQDRELEVDELESVYRYFQAVHKIWEQEDQLLEAALKEPVSVSVDKSYDAIFQRVNELSNRLGALKTPSASSISNHFQVTNSDLRSQLSLVKVSLAPLEYVNEFGRQLAQNSNPGEYVEEHFQKATQEQEELQTFNQEFNQILGSLNQVSTILGNVAVSFGRVYNNSSPRTITPVFLGRVLTTIQGLLQKALRIMATHQKSLVRVKEIGEGISFVPALTNGLFRAIGEIEQARNEIDRYNLQILDLIQKSSENTKARPSQVYGWLHEAYESRTSLASACMVLGGVEMVGNLITQATEQLERFHKRIEEVHQQQQDPESLVSGLQKMLEGEAGQYEELLEEASRNLEIIGWVLEDALERTGNEEEQFRETADQLLVPARTRARSTQKAAKNAPSTPGAEIPGTPAAEPGAPAAKKSEPQAEVDPLKALQAMHRQNTGSRFDPFPANLMEVLRRTTRRMQTPHGDMMYYILTHPHMMFDALDKAEAIYNQGNSISHLEDTMMKSKTASDFIVNFARLKLLSDGYYNSHSKPYEYNDGKKRFEVPAQAEKFLMVAKNSFETPKGVFDRLVRVMLRMDDPKMVEKMMGSQAFAILRSDFTLSEEESHQIQDAMAMM